MADYELHMRTVKDELFEPCEVPRPAGHPRRDRWAPTEHEILRGLNVVGVEPNEESHSYAHENANRHGVKSLECVSWRVASLEDASWTR